MTEKQYRSHPGINFTSLTWLDIHPRVYYKNKFKPSPEEDKTYFAVGGGLDILLTGGIKEFKKQYYILTHARPSGMLGIFIEKYLFYIKNEVPDNIAFDQAYVDSGYKISKQRIQALLEKDKYWQEKSKYMHKYRTLDADEGEIVLNMAEVITNHPRTLHFFKPIDGVEIHYQKIIIFNVLGRECKAMLDILYIDHNTKTISPIDLKTTGKYVDEFKKSFYSYRYFIQAAFYTEAVKQWIQYMSVSGQFDYSGYTVDLFRFLVIEKQKDGVALVYQCTQDDIDGGTYGGYIRNEYQRGYVDLIKDLIWHESTKNWSAPRDVYERKFEIQLNIFDSVNRCSYEEKEELFKFE